MDKDLTFDFRDEFQRKMIAENIDKLLNSGMELSPLMIDGNWGTGKTEFSHKLGNLLSEHEKSHVVYIDAFREDHIDSPILSITAAIAKILPGKERANFIKKSLPALRFVVKTVGKSAVSYILKQEADKIAEELQDALKNTGNAIIDSTVENLLNDHINAEKNIKSLQETLELIAEKKRIIIIVDELDRCRPSFAVSFLEKIKHIFDTKNVSFILVANANQLKASINHIYGHAIDSQKYLDKFIKYSFNLPKTISNSGKHDKLASVSHWHNIASHDEHLLSINSTFSDIIDDLISRANLSLRETEDIARRLKVYQVLSKNPIERGRNPLVNFSKLMAVFIHSLCSRDVIDSFPSQDSLESMAIKLGIDRLPYETQYEIDEPDPILEMVFFLFIKEHLPSNDFLNPSIINRPSNLEERIIKSYGISIVKQANIKQTVFNTISIVTTAI